MRAIEVSRFGGPEVLKQVELPTPVLGRGEVLIAVRLIEVLFLDTQLRSGWGAGFFPMRPPWVPGTGVAGEIVAVGGGVDARRVGERVVARTGDEGAYAEEVAVLAVEATRVPDGLDLAVAIAALHDGVLALDRLERAELGAGSRVLVTAAAGSLGHWFVPLAKAAGARVSGAAGGERKVAAVRRLGADVAVDYRLPDWGSRAGGPFDVVFDGAGGDIGTTAFGLIADGGMFAGHGAASGTFGSARHSRGIRTVGVDTQLDEATWRRLTAEGLELLARGAIQPQIGQQVPLERAGDAHAAMAARSVIGKTLLTV
ncbi:MAG TPA: zinc-binding dehydrogenase [Microlunatus sp.]